MEEVGVSAAAVLPGAPQPTFCRTSASDRRMRKSGSANIFQGVNLRQLRRLFHSAGEPDAEQKARQVWRNRRRTDGDEEDGDGDEVSDKEEDEGLAQALVGLRVRARTRSGIRAETSRGVRAVGHSRASERTPSEVPADTDAKSCDPAKEEEMGTTWSRDEKDPERYLHRIRH
ncbi:arginine vasopressin-induced protein 1 [Tachysurus fulvidraco]|uniref:arginine vasopressin-induced protein 1 n=1 Tax=Tachysurus fulvidraco TaxID=1234273 RepID=UPI001FEE3A7B|nr:arginine vasopressin-induced protein 1 [Tachysurus fulvidraco]